MKVKKIRCANHDCRQWFQPDSRSIRGDDEKSCQRYCLKPDCRKARKKEAQAKWWAKNPDYFKGDTPKKDCQNWAQEHPGYWKDWRKDHPDYVEANRQKQRIRDKRRLFLANKDEIAQNPLGHLKSIRFLAQKNLANKDEIRLPVEGILDFLVVKESLANKDECAAQALVAA